MELIKIISSKENSNSKNKNKINKTKTNHKNNKNKNKIENLQRKITSRLNKITIKTINYSCK